MEVQNATLPHAGRKRFQQALNLKGKSNFPTITLDSRRSLFEIKGKSTGSNAAEYFCSSIRWMKDYLQNPNLNTVLDIQLDSLNFDTSQSILHILYALNDVYKRGFNVRVRWFYKKGEDDMMEIGEDMGYMVQCPVELIPMSA